jgi:thiamine pyrophosphokinase
MHAIVVADGDPPDRDALDAAWPGWADGVELVVAADGGARGVAGLGWRPDLVIGDLDSIDDALLAGLVGAGVEVDRRSLDKDETDAELAVHAAIERGATQVTVLGAFGGPRLDHELANLALLALPDLAGREAVLLDPRARVVLLQAPATGDRAACLDLGGPIGAVISLLPFGADAGGVTTSGLRYPLTNEDLAVGPARGLSNVRLAADAAVCLRRGRLLVIEMPATPATLRP